LRWSHNGIEAVSRSFSWDAHTNRYLLEALPALALDGSFGDFEVLSMAARHRPMQSDSRCAPAITTRQKYHWF